jgi:hypothetical protein
MRMNPAMAMRIAKPNRIFKNVFMWAPERGYLSAY